MVTVKKRCEMHIKVNEYNAIELNEYNGIFELVAGVEKDDKFFKNWNIASTYDSEVGGSVPSKKEDGRYRNVPAKVILGDREQAIKNLRLLLEQLEEAIVPPPSGDVPF